MICRGDYEYQEPITELRLYRAGIASGVNQLQVDKRAGQQL